MKVVQSFLLLAVVILVAGCTSPSALNGKPLPAMTFKHLQPVVLNVASTEIQVRPSLTSEGFSYPLDDMVDFYLQRKLNAVGQKGNILASLEESSIKRLYEPSEYEALSYFDLAGFDVYEVALKLRLEHQADNGGEPLYGTVINARRLIKVSQHTSIVEREQAQFEGLEQLFLELDSHVDKVLIQDMKLKISRNAVTTPPTP